MQTCITRNEDERCHLLPRKTQKIHWKPLSCDAEPKRSLNHAEEEPPRTELDTLCWSIP